jgi:N-acetyl-1-D-myo-inositol-2-amino-2-deoxy-alpha-D-glucopyranoside deacetylase
MTSDALPDRRLLLVHAHPDDEAINNGVTMAKYAAEGAAVTLLTCTLGEEGEVLVPSLEHLASHRDDGLGRYRISELADAMSILGVKDWRFLGGEGRYRDTGMAEDEDGMAIPPPDVRPDSFWAADLLEASTHVVEVIRETRPQVLITYDEDGNYGHPDHVQAHRVAMYGSTLAAAPTFRPDLGEAWEISKIYWPGMSDSRFREGLRKLAEIGDTTFEGLDPDGPLPGFVTPDDQLSTRIDGHDYVDQKIKAMQAHATQITVDGPFFALSNNMGNTVWAEEFYRIAKGRGVPGPDGFETDLFAGVA